MFFSRPCGTCSFCCTFPALASRRPGLLSFAPAALVTAAGGGCVPHSFHSLVPQAAEGGCACSSVVPAGLILFVTRSRHLLRAVPGYFHSRLRRWLPQPGAAAFHILFIHWYRRQPRAAALVLQSSLRDLFFVLHVPGTCFAACRATFIRACGAGCRSRGRLRSTFFSSLPHAVEAAALQVL